MSRAQNPINKGHSRHFDQSHRRIYIDLDNTLCDFAAHYHAVRTEFPELKFPQSLPGFFTALKPMPGAVAAFQQLRALPATTVFILTAPSVRNVHCYTEKRVWVEQHLGLDAAYRLIISPNKGLLLGDYLIDDLAEGKGQEYFSGELIHFGTVRYPDWATVLSHSAFNVTND